MTDIILQRGKCVYWGCANYAKGIYCKEHKPERCRVCNCLPYGSRGLTYGLCLKHYKYWQRHNSPQRARILATDRKRAARVAAERRAARAQKAGWKPQTPEERLAIGGWSSGACITRHLELVQ